MRSLGVAENMNANEVASSRPSRCADETTQWGVVTRNDYARNHFDRQGVDCRLCKSEVEMATGYHHICAVASPDGDEVAEMATDRHLVHDEGNPACIDAVGLMNPSQKWSESDRILTVRE